jgi:hypothetical protein
MMMHLQRSDAGEALLVDRDVDRSPDVHRATTGGEEQILRELYGEPDADGIFRGEGQDLQDGPA